MYFLLTYSSNNVFSCVPGEMPSKTNLKREKFNSNIVELYTVCILELYKQSYTVNVLFPCRKLIKTDESVVDRAKANASLWEARLEVTELSRIEYRDTSRTLAKSNEDLKKKQCKMEKDIMSVLSYLKKQDQEKDNMVGRQKTSSASLTTSMVILMWLCISKIFNSLKS